ncbi:ABC-type transport system involved in multi-copper enzyme maturation permease subunit [Nocardioides daedukensis]|uniref:ABC-type transport system involved in multi-copper enzyme maturation permease subunit n=1 Tax=Nocardioides daedukensis TaxID=634462 RepID=A0A7Y9UNA3_9ACTN|nr:ABC transporter permease [Nocardioides daedukensis]NYG58348.1 ABC-type transport system involved in multi-copper enzyme maturation permease subunit [Nocardioides daedukensis]
MSTATTATPELEPGHIDISQSRRPSMMTLIGVEIRKMTDTRAGLWLLIAIGVITVLINTLFLIFGDRDDLPFLAFLQFSAMPQGILLPVLAVLLVTQEWGQRTGLVTFAQVPHRSKVLGAKLLAAVLFVLAAFAIAVAVAAVLTPIAGADDPWQDVTLPYMARVILALVIGGLWGYAFGVALLNSAFAIVAYFAVPTVVSIVTAIWTSARDALLWFDLSTSSSMLFDPNGVSGKDWAQIGVGALLWIALPMALGWFRVTRMEIK